ncbi:MAG: PQQ-like beta-propeller repeat protein [Campylobacteraceae bacterium]|jgi:outer membrane protein assembly factor BamB|nr:PQQ-like beta-propeller repeat protein [Campylobacteraceae bacterium]
MLKAVISISILALALSLNGCGTKRQYFEPDSISGRIKSSGSLSSNLKEAAKNGASLQNGKIITLKGEENDIKLEKGHSFLGEFNGRFITASPTGDIHVKNSDDFTVYTLNLNTIIASASIDAQTLAVIAADNTLYLIDMSSNSTLFQKKMDVMAAVDSRIAAPYFLGNLIIFPTLDGKLTIVDRSSGTLVRDVVISSEREFNNIIFLDVSGDRMFASTAKRIIGISPGGINYIDEEIKNAVIAGDKVFVFTKDGRVLLCDLELKVLSEKRFPFAIFAGVSANEKLYILEKMGYLIKSDLELKEFEVLKFPSKIDDFLFMTKDKIFYQNNFYTLE